MKFEKLLRTPPLAASGSSIFDWIFWLATNTSLGIPFTIIFFITHLENFSGASLTYLATQVLLVKKKKKRVTDLCRDG